MYCALKVAIVNISIYINLNVCQVCKSGETIVLETLLEREIRQLEDVTIFPSSISISGWFLREGEVPHILVLWFVLIKY